MRQSIYREEKPNQTSKEPCRFLTDLFLWGMEKRVQPSWQQKQTWSGPQLQLDLRSMWSVLQQIGHLTRYVAALGWVLIQVLSVTSSVVSAWPLVSRAGHSGVLRCPICWSTDHILRRSSCSCGPLHVCFCCQATYRVTTNKYPPRKEPSCRRDWGSAWRTRDQRLV
jgi:hypothetical protein